MMLQERPKRLAPRVSMRHKTITPIGPEPFKKTFFLAEEKKRSNYEKWKKYRKTYRRGSTRKSSSKYDHLLRRHMFFAIGLVIDVCALRRGRAGLRLKNDYKIIPVINHRER